MLNLRDLIGRKCTFDHDGKRLTGIVTAAEPSEPFGRGAIPDLRITVRGQSGRELKVSLVETYMDFPDK